MSITTTLVLARPSKKPSSLADGWTGGQTDGRTEGRTDGRTCNDIVLSRHDRKIIFMENISESSNRKNPSSTVWLTGGRAGGRTDGRTDL